MLRAALPALCLMLAACATTAPEQKAAAEPAPPLGDRYEIKFPKAPGYERGSYRASTGDVPMHHFKAVEGKVDFELGYVTLDGFHERGDPKAIQAAVEAQIKDTLSVNGVRMLASEAVNLANADFAKSFVGTRDGQTVSGLGCAAGDRLYVLMTQLDQSDAAQVSAGAAFTASFRP